MGLCHTKEVVTKYVVKDDPNYLTLNDPDEWLGIDMVSYYRGTKSEWHAVLLKNIKIKARGLPCDVIIRVNRQQYKQKLEKEIKENDDRMLEEVTKTKKQSRRLEAKIDDLCLSSISNSMELN